MMARPREFEVDQALRDAAEVFRIKGYSGTSLEDLILGTGLAKGSLYKAFHDKKSLFLGALGLFSEESLGQFKAALTKDGSPREAIRQTLTGYIQRARTNLGSAGCLITNTAVELGANDEQIANQVKATFRRQTDMFEAAVRRAQAVGEIDPRKDARELAEFLELTVQGLRVMVKTQPDEVRLLNSIEVALSVLN